MTNILAIVTILNARKKNSRVDKDTKKQLANLKEAFFTYMLINSILNSFYCLMFFFDYSIKCAPILVDKDSTKDNCLQKDIWIGTVGSVLKLMGNFTSIQMSLNRYLLVGKDHQKWIEKVARMKISLMLVASLTCSTKLSVIVVFQEYFFSNPASNRKGGLLLNENNNYHHYAWNKIEGGVQIGHDYALVNTKLTYQLPFIFAFTLIHDLFSYFLLGIEINNWIFFFFFKLFI